MSKFNENYTKALKDFILYGNVKESSLKKAHDEELQKFTSGKSIEDSPKEIFEEERFYKSEYIAKCNHIIESIPILYFKNIFKEIILNFNNAESDYLMNMGSRISSGETKEVTFEEWRNIISKENKNNILLSLHKIYSGDKYEVKLTHNFNIYVIEIELNDNTYINNIKYIENKGPITISYSTVSVNNESEILSNLLYKNKDDNSYEEINEKMFYTKNDTSDLVTINKVETKTIKKEENFDYLEKNYEVYFIDPLCKKKWGKKSYENNKNRKYEEDWVCIDLENNGLEEKYHKYLDDGCGKQTTEDHGKRTVNGNEVDYDYTDKYIYNVTNGDELTTKIGFDRYNKWNCSNYRNRIKNFSHVNNEASNSENKMEWKEKWDEEGNEKTCTKWGRSEDEEWEESWKEIYDNEKDYSEKVCHKKCKKLKEDKEWYETWTEKNNGKPNCEKTCYKMNREGGNKYENYWGNIIVNYLDNKRMNYVGYINNNDKKEFINYTYENTNN